jgi:iron complex outermembrane recepter protein
MFRFYFVAAFVVLAQGLYAQLTISGTVRESKNNQPLIGAAIQAEGANRFSVSDDLGHFELTGLKPGDYVLHIKFLGYNDRTENVQLNANTEIAIQMEESVQMTDEVVVYATRANDKTPTTFTNVSTQAIQKQNFGQDLPMLLNWTPSLVTTSDAGAGVGYTGIRIRGSDATRINVTINGIPYNDSESQGTYWVDVPDVASSAQSIQIQRGVGTSTNGGSAFGASVNLQTNTLIADPYTELYASGGSFNTQRYTLRTGTGLINNHWAFDAKLSKIKSDGYVERASSDLDSYYLSGGYYGKKTIIKAITFGGHEKTYQSWYGLDEATMKTNRRFNYAGAIYDENYNVLRYYDNQVDNYRQDHYQLHFSHQLNSNWNANISLHYTYGRGYYEEYHQGESFSNFNLENVVIKDSTIESTDAIVRKWLDNKFYGTTFSLNYEKGKTNLTIGGAWNQYGHAKHFGEVVWMQYASNGPIRYRYYNGDAQKNDFNIYTKWNYSFTEALNGFVDIQYRYVDYKTSGIEDGQFPYDVKDKFNFFNPKAGLSYTLSKSDILYGSYAVANREPNRTDYLGNDVKPKSEHLENLEIGWRRSKSKYSFEANYYLMNYTNQLVLTGQLNNVGSPIRANVGKSFRTGVELTGTIRVTGKLTWNVNVTKSVNKNIDYAYDESDVTVKKNTDITLSPKWIAGSQLNWNAFKNFQATLMTKYVGKQFLDNTQSESKTLKDYMINDLRLSYSIHPKGIKEIGLGFLLNNMFDVTYSSNGYVYDNTGYYYPQAGRNFLAMLTLKF